MDAADLVPSADNTTNQLASGSNLCTGPQNRVLQHGFGADPAIFSNDRTATHLCAWIDNRRFMDGRPPIRIAYRIVWKIVVRQVTMQLQIGVTVSHVPPVTFINYDSADRSTASNRIDKIGNDGTFHSRLKKIDKFSIDNVNARENEFVRRAGTQLI